MGGEVGERCFLYVLFVADLHSGLLCCIFAVAREVRGRFPFLDPQPPNGPPPPGRGLFHPDIDLRKGLFELLVRAE